MLVPPRDKPDLITWMDGELLYPVARLNVSFGGATYSGRVIPIRSSVTVAGAGVKEGLVRIRKLGRSFGRKVSSVDETPTAIS